jgi:hypothetical protein
VTRDWFKITLTGRANSSTVLRSGAVRADARHAESEGAPRG